MKFKFQKVNGKADVNWEHINTYISRWKDGTWFDQEIIRHQHKKSDPLRKYYFVAVLPPFMSKLGYEKDEDELFHRQLKITYYRIKPDRKGIYRKVPSVFGDKSEILVSGKKEFVDWVIRKAAEEGVYIEDPKRSE